MGREAAPRLLGLRLLCWDGVCRHTASLAAIHTQQAKLACSPDVSFQIRLKRENDFIVVVFQLLLLPGPVLLHLSQVTQRR